jgi:hypothetical protein
MSILILASINFQRCRICGNLHTCRPIGVHLTILVVETLELQLEIRPTHESIVDGWLELKDVIAHGEIVLEAEWRQNYAVTNRKR